MRSGKQVQRFDGRPFLGRLFFPLGLLLPLLATIFVALHAGLSFPSGLWKAQQSTPWLWLIDALPLIFAFYGRFLAQPSLGSRSAPLLLAILMLLFLMPCSAMVYAWQEARETVRNLRNTRQAGQLQTLSLRVYIQLSQKPKSDPRAELAKMSQIRKEIKVTSPDAVTATEPAWNQFYQEAIRPGKLTWATTLRMQDDTDRLAHSLEIDTRTGSDSAAQLLLGGIISTLLFMALPLQLFYQLRLIENQVIEGQRQRTKLSQRLESATAQLEEANQKIVTANSERELTELRDPLTGLYNRHALTERFQSEWNRAVRYREPLTVILLDIDYFTTYNDSFGQSAGDAVLETIGMILQHAVRITDFPLRYGETEFMILLPQTSEDEAARIAERIRTAIQVAPWKNRSITVSIGVAERTTTMVSPAELLAAAALALHHAQQTRNQVCNARTIPATAKKAA